MNLQHPNIKEPEIIHFRQIEGHQWDTELESLSSNPKSVFRYWVKSAFAHIDISTQINNTSKFLTFAKLMFDREFERELSRINYNITGSELEDFYIRIKSIVPKISFERIGFDIVPNEKFRISLKTSSDKLAIILFDKEFGCNDNVMLTLFNGKKVEFANLVKIEDLREIFG